MTKVKQEIDSDLFDLSGAVILPSKEIQLGFQGRPFAVRANCKDGQFALSETQFLGREAEFGIIRLDSFFGSLGKTEDSDWMQIFTVMSPGCKLKGIPDGVVCVTYLKTRSLDQFSNTMTALSVDLAKQLAKADPSLSPVELQRAVSAKIGKGLFTASFQSHAGSKGTYYSLDWDWRERETEAELQQLQAIQRFLSARPSLADDRGTAKMHRLSMMDSDKVQELRQQAQQKRLAASGN